MTNHYRPPTRMRDGSISYQAPEDAVAERVVSDAIRREWGWTLRRWPSLAPIDFYAEARERLVGLVEVKGKGHRMGQYPDEWVSVAKVLSLQRAELGLGVPAFLVIRWADGHVGYIHAWQARGSLEMLSRRRESPAPSDREPIIRVPSESFRCLEFGA